MTINRLNRGRSLSRITGGISASASIQATGGNSTQTYAEDGKNWQAHIFNATGPFSVNSISGVIPSSITYNPSTDRRIGNQTVSGQVQYLLVAGGGGTGYKLASTVSVAADTTLVVLDRASSIYLPENKSIVVNGTNNTLDVVCSYEKIID